MSFFKLISDIFNVSSVADRIKADPEKRAKSARIAVASIAYSVVAVMFAAAGAYLVLSLEAAGLLAVFVLVIGITLLVGTVVALVGALVRLIAQFSINRSAMTWIALAAFIIGIALSAAVVLIFLN